MRRLAPAAAFFAAVARVAAAQEAPPDASIRIDASAREVLFGEAFDVVVSARYPADAIAEPFAPESLAPLWLVLRERSRAWRDGMVEDRRTYEARAFFLGEREIPAPRLVFEPAGARELREVRGEPLRLRSVPALPAGASEELEGFDRPLPVPRRVPLSAVLFGLLAAAATGLLAWTFRLRGGHGRFRSLDVAGWIERLEGPDPEPRAALFHAAHVVRSYLARHDPALSTRSTEELLAALAGDESFPRRGLTLLAEFLASSDAARFRETPPTPEDLDRALAQARRLLRELADDPTREAAA